MTPSDPSNADDRAASKDVDMLVTLPGVHSATGDEKAGSGDSEPAGTDPALSDVASETYPVHPTFGGPPDRHH